MYEQGLRLGREAPGLKSLQKQVWNILLFFMLGEFVLGERGGGGGGCIALQAVITSPS